MKLVAIALCLTGTLLVGQRSGGPGGGGPGGSGSGGGAHYGRMVNPGGGPISGRIVYPGGSGAPMASRAPGALGLPVPYATPPVVSHPQNHGGALFVPYPVFYGGGYYGYDAPPAPNSGGYYYDPSTGARQDSPVVIINQNYVPDTVNPSFQDYSDTQLPPATLRRHDNPSQPYGDTSAQAPLPDDQPSIYLIALKDHTIVAAIGYWVEADTVNYITQDNAHKRVSLDEVDRPFTKQLNDERHIDLRLPPEK